MWFLLTYLTWHMGTFSGANCPSVKITTKTNTVTDGQASPPCDTQSGSFWEEIIDFVIDLSIRNYTRSKLTKELSSSERNLPYFVPCLSINYIFCNYLCLPDWQHICKTHLKLFHHKTDRGNELISMEIFPYCYCCLPTNWSVRIFVQI